MSFGANYCRKCEQYILGDFCFECQEPITQELPNIFKDIFGENNE